MPLRLRAAATPPCRRHISLLFTPLLMRCHADISPLFEAPCHYVLPPPTPLLLLIIIERYCLFTLLFDAITPA
jgi:hypothetical protein